MTKALKDLLPSATVTSAVGRGSSFEVVVNSQFLAYSKLASGAFPDYAVVSRDIAAFATSGATAPTWKAAA